MAGNLENWGIVKKAASSNKFINIALIIDTGKRYGKEIVVALSALVVVLTSAYQYYKDNIDKDTVPVVVQDESTELTNRAIKRANDPIYGSNIIKSRFSDSGIRADLIFPDRPVGVYKLVKIRTDEESKFYDLFVMTVNNGKIIFVDSVATANKGEWVFTGPPGDYAIRLSAYNPDTGVKITVGNVIIGGDIPVPVPPGPAPNPVPTPTPNPTPSPVTPVFTEKYGFSTLAFTTVSTKVAAEDRKYASMLADNFEAVAAGIAAGSWRTPDEANKELAGRNRLTFNNDTILIGKWMAFFEAWSAKAKELNTSGKLPNMVDEYRLVYIETVKGLRAIK